MAVRIQQEDFDSAFEVARLSVGSSNVGAIVTFTGVVRAKGEAFNSVASITLEHYCGMAEAELNRIEQIARAKWNLSDCLIIHRVGTLKCGDNIVLVATTAEHRTPAFEAAMHLMDRLKSDAPFWKKECGSDGGAEWVRPRFKLEEDVNPLGFSCYS